MPPRFFTPRHNRHQVILEMKEHPQDGEVVSAKTQTRPTDDDFVYPKGIRLALLMTSIFIGMFLVALDKLIITTALAQITNDFNSTNDIGWYGTAYLLTNCAFLLVFGKIYTLMNVKATFLTAVTLFEIGSAICGAAPNSIAFIIGRAVAGLGAGGIQSGVIVIIVYAVPLENRPMYQGLFGAVYGISSVLGPLVGGAFTTNVTWRWCFYINLPLGGVVLIFVFFLLKAPNPAMSTSTLRQKLQQLNAEGLVALLPGVVCLCLALQWGGFTYQWHDGRIVALLVVAFVLLIAFVFIQIWRPERATVPPRIFVQRSICSAFFVSCCLGAHQTIVQRSLLPPSLVPSYQRRLGHPERHPPPTSGDCPRRCVGISTTRVGYYTPFLIFGICVTAVGVGLLNTLHIDTTVGQWIGYQILYGFGFGACVQAPNMAAQTVLPRDEVSIGASLMLFGQTLFGAIFVSIGQNVLDGQLAKRLGGITTITPQQIEDSGATGTLGVIPTQYHAAALEAYNSSLRVCFQIALIMACVAILGGLGMEWRSVKKQQQDPHPTKGPDEQNVEEGKETSDLTEK
ncbi:hypothetical protein G7046_g4039 [Stylonectria norvegica]|nr:hypothetical protein G7046_g4039 [Stylonectria norvegica]